MSRRKLATTNFAEASRPPGSEPFVWLTRELLKSNAWRTRSPNCIRLIERLMLENCRHAGRENGALVCTYDQLAEWGIGRRLIKPAILEAVFLGLIEVRSGGQKGVVEDHPNRYRLTFAASKVGGPHGDYYIAPTDEWRRHGTEYPNQKTGSPSCTKMVHLRELKHAMRAYQQAHADREKRRKSAKIARIRPAAE